MIRNLLSEHDITLDVIAGTKLSALTKISIGLAQRACVTQTSVASDLLAREEIGSTALGEGIAVPHALLNDLSYPVASLTRLARPIEFEAPDSNPVDLLFALLWPRRSARQFLPNLASVSRMFRNEALCHALRKARTSAEAFAIICSEPTMLTTITQNSSASRRGGIFLKATEDLPKVPAVKLGSRLVTTPH